MKKSMWKKLMSTILALVMVLGLSGTLGFQHVDATENSGFTFLPDKTEVKRGDIVTYSIDLAKNAKIAGITAQFTFDPDVLEAVGDGVDAKGYVKNAVKKGNVSEGTFGDFYVNTDGRIGIVAILNDNDKDKLADGNVAKISFKVKDTAKGDIGLKVKNLEFCDVNSEDIPTSEISVTKDNDAQIKVVVLATGITVDKTATTIVKGATDKLTATLVPADANGTITWSTSDSSVATVSSDGTVTAVKNGTATVTAKCGDLSAQTKVTVINPLKAITITGTTHSIKKGQTTQLGLTYDPADTTDSVAATWTSSNTSVATVSKTGLVTALKDGSTTIKATVGNVSSTYDIAVKEVKLTGIKMEEKALIHKGDTKALTVEYTPADTTDDKTVAWSSSDSTVASVDNNGIVTAVKPGSAVITAKVGNYQATCAVTVDAPLKEIVPEKAIIDMVKKQTATVTWKSSDSDVVKVDEKTGMVYAVKAGKADVTATTKAVDNATAKPFTATTTVTVKENNMTDEIGKKLAFDEFDDLLIGQKDNANNYLNLSELIEANNITDDINVEFASSDKAVATIDNDGNVFGLKAGKTIITATVIAIAGDGSKNVYTAEGELTVKTIPLNSIAFDKVIKEMKLGATDTLSIIYNPQNTTDAKDVTWTSSNPSVISVENGKLTANAVGTADITAKVGDKTVTCTITVKEEKKAEQPKPVITNKKSDNKPAAKSVSKAKTGDNNNVVLFLVMFAAAVAMIGVITGKSLRRNRR